MIKDIFSRQLANDSANGKSFVESPFGKPRVFPVSTLQDFVRPANTKINFGGAVDAAQKAAALKKSVPKKSGGLLSAIKAALMPGSSVQTALPAVPGTPSKFGFILPLVALICGIVLFIVFKNSNKYGKAVYKSKRR